MMRHGRLKVYRVLLLIAMVAPQVFGYNDPTQPAGVSNGVRNAPSALKLESILISGKRKLAIINGRRYVLGDVVSGARITHISEQVVILTAGAKQQKLQLFKPIRL